MISMGVIMVSAEDIKNAEEYKAWSSKKHIELEKLNNNIQQTIDDFNIRVRIIMLARSINELEERLQSRNLKKSDQSSSKANDIEITNMRKNIIEFNKDLDDLKKYANDHGIDTKNLNSLSHPDDYRSRQGNHLSFPKVSIPSIEEVPTKKVSLTFGQKLFNIFIGWIPGVKKYPTKVKDFNSVLKSVDEKIKTAQEKVDKTTEIRTRIGNADIRIKGLIDRLNNQAVESRDDNLEATGDRLEAAAAAAAAAATTEPTATSTTVTATQPQNLADVRINVPKPMPGITAEKTGVVNHQHQEVARGEKDRFKPADNRFTTPQQHAPELDVTPAEVSAADISPIDVTPVTAPIAPPITPSVGEIPNAPEAPIAPTAPVAPNASDNINVNNASNNAEASAASNANLANDLQKGIGNLKKVDKTNQPQTQQELDPRDALLNKIKKGVVLKKVERPVEQNVVADPSGFGGLLKNVNQKRFIKEESIRDRSKSAQEFDLPSSSPSDLANSKPDIQTPKVQKINEYVEFKPLTEAERAQKEATDRANAEKMREKMKFIRARARAETIEEDDDESNKPDGKKPGSGKK